MNILQITKKFPYPFIDGEVIAIHNLTKGFAALNHSVTVLSLNTQKHYFNLQKLTDNIKRLATYDAVNIDTSIKPVNAFLNLFTSKSYNIERFYSIAFEQKIVATLAAKNFDFILLEGIYLMRYIDIIRRNTKAKVVLRPHNVEYIIWQRLWQNETNPLKKIYLQLLAKRIKKFELENISKADLLIPVSETDRKIFIEHGCTLPSQTFPIGYELTTGAAVSNIGTGITEEENAISFIGGMDWLPNREGVEWFLKNVWLNVVEQIPDAKFYLAGRNFPDEIKSLKVKGLVIIGEVADAQKFIASKSISVVPLFAGSGMRVKIIEAMALGRAIVSTSVGAEGIDYTNNKNILIADDETSFAEAIIKTLRDSALRHQLGHNAKQLVNTQYDNSKICSAIIDFCKPYL